MRGEGTDGIALSQNVELGTPNSKVILIHTFEIWSSSPAVGEETHTPKRWLYPDGRTRLEPYKYASI